MKSPGGVMQRLTARLLAHAVRVMPARRADWARAMTQETANLPETRTALLWAVGCVTASYGERMRESRFYLPLLARIGLAGLALEYGIQALDYVSGSAQCRLFGSARHIAVAWGHLTLPWLRGLHSVGFLEPWPCGQLHTWTVPFFENALSLVTAGLYAWSGVLTARNRRAALPIYFCGFFLSITVNCFRSAVATRYFNDPNWWLEFSNLAVPWKDPLWLLFTVTYPIIIGLCIGLAVHQGGARQSRDLTD